MGLTNAEVPSAMINTHRLDRPNALELVGEVRRFFYHVPTGSARTGANEIQVEGITEKAKLAGAELWITQGES